MREHDSPELPLVKRETLKRWAYPARCRDAKELAERLPLWEVWGQELELSRGQPLDEDAKTAALDALVPHEYRTALDDHLELTTHAQRLTFVKQRLGQAKHRALAQDVLGLAGSPQAMEVAPVIEEGKNRVAFWLVNHAAVCRAWPP